MIVRFMPAGRSFKWLSEYLNHDPQAQSAERVAWTHTLNLAHDDPASAVDEMLRTFQYRELLKAEAGIRPGGAKLEKPVKHVSLNWHPSERVSRDEMIAATQAFMKAMGWQDHQALVVAHSDTPHPHVHVMLNAVHPEHGTRLNDGFERRRAQQWALGYEQQRGKIFCEERLKPLADREASPPRNVWEQLRRLRPDDIGYTHAPSFSFSKPDYQAAPRVWHSQEWKRLKAQQQAERMGFFIGGKEVYRGLRNAVYRDVRGTYRAEWRDYYALKRSAAAADRLKAMRGDLIARQRATLDAQIMGTAQELRQQRDLSYRALLDRQAEQRAALTAAQKAGRPSPSLFDGNRSSDPAQGARVHQDNERAKEAASDQFG